ncbi:hypothetical protein Nepgr_013179 [Nepenthes gracilis]|uniref:Uncharacterized protein n=1 Tax=Nepenthes gracilis TaxID=150966 RepID=A0AAD3XNR7_NEPGR|nr:hypothetical protein Nepgr_013179 [Nepenthes gracilis]
MEDLQPTKHLSTPIAATSAANSGDITTYLQNSTINADAISADPSPPEDYYIVSNCSTPYVSAPSSPGRPIGSGLCYSVPASPSRFMLSASSRSSEVISIVPSQSDESSTASSASFEFEFSARLANSNRSATTESGSMSSAEELFLNGLIRPMKLSTHLPRPKVLAPLLDVAEKPNDGDYNKSAVGEEEDDNRDDVFRRRRDLRLRDKSLRRRARSLSPLRDTASFDWGELVAKEEEIGRVEKILNAEIDDSKGGVDTAQSASASSSRCPSAGRSSKRWLFLKDFLRSKSEGRSNGNFWSNISFSPAKEKKSSSSHQSHLTCSTANDSKEKIDEASKLRKVEKSPPGKKSPSGKPANGAVGKRRVPPSPHELHYTAHRAQAEEMRRKTFLPYRQGLLGCLGFSSKTYGAMNGFARTLNPLSSR